MSDTAAGGATEQERDLLWRARNSHETRVRARTLADEELVKLGARPVGVAPYEGQIAALLVLADEALTGRAELVALRAQQERSVEIIAAQQEALAVYAEPGNWSEADSEHPYTGTWYAGRGRQMQDIFIPQGDGWRIAADALDTARQSVAPDPPGVVRPAAGTAPAGPGEEA